VTSAEINASDATPGTARFVIGTEAENMEVTRRRVQDLIVRRGLLLRRGEPMKLNLESVFLKLVS
jgi:hypothetical protein